MYSYIWDSLYNIWGEFSGINVTSAVLSSHCVPGIWHFETHFRDNSLSLLSGQRFKLGTIMDWIKGHMKLRLQSL